MRTLTLNACDDKSDFVESINSASLAVLPPLFQGDTIQIAVTKPVRPDKPSSTLAAFVVKPWTFTQIRFSLGYIDKAPESGSFKVRVGGTTSNAITWPTDPTDTTQLAAFRTAVLAAVNAVAGTGAARISNPVTPTTPANFLYVTWTNPADTRVIEVVESTLIPPIDADQVVTNTTPAPAYEQLIKLIRLPLVETTTFAFPGNAAPDVESEVPGTTGRNAVQIVSLNSATIGAIALIWSGAQTDPLSIQGLTAAQIEAALNKIVAGGATNPSFSVAARAASPGTTKFAVTFIGPLANAPQANLEAAALGQETQLTAYGSLFLRRDLFERSLNGAGSCQLSAELVITDAGGESTFLRTITLINDMTGPGTESAIAAGGGILTIPTIVYIDESTADPFITAAAGLSYTVPIFAVGSSIVSVPHTAFESLLVGVRVHKQTAPDGSPEIWVECKDTEYGNSSADTTNTVVTFPFNFVNDPTLPAHYARWKILLTDPDATVALSAFKLTWDDVLASLPSGQTVRAKLAQIDAALGVFSGTLRVAAGNIDGTLSATQIDAAGLAPSIVNQASFSTALQALYQTSPALVTNLLTQIAASSTFTSTLVTAITNNSPIGDAITNLLATNSTFTSNLQSLVLDVIQGTGNQPAGATTYFIDPVTISMPAPQQMFAPAITSTVPATEQSTIVAGGTTTVVSKATEATVSTPGFTPVYAALSPQLTGLTNGGTKTGKLPATDAGTAYYTVTGSAKSSSARGLRGQAFKDGDVIAFAAGHWSRMVSIGGVHYPADFEQPLVKTLIVDATELYAGSRFSLVFPTFFQLLGNVTGRVNVIAEIGTETSSDAEPASWTQLFSEAVHLSATARLRTFGITVTHAAGGALTGTYSLQGQPTIFTPASASFALRARLSKLTLGASSDPRGDLSVRIAKGAALASIVAL